MHEIMSQWAAKDLSFDEMLDTVCVRVWLCVRVRLRVCVCVCGCVRARAWMGVCVCLRGSVFDGFHVSV